MAVDFKTIGRQLYYDPADVRWRQLTNDSSLLFARLGILRRPDTYGADHIGKADAKS